MLTAPQRRAFLRFVLDRCQGWFPLKDLSRQAGVLMLRAAEAAAVRMGPVMMHGGGRLSLLPRAVLDTMPARILALVRAATDPAATAASRRSSPRVRGCRAGAQPGLSSSFSSSQSARASREFNGDWGAIDDESDEDEDNKDWRRRTHDNNTGGAFDDGAAEDEDEDEDETEAEIASALALLPGLVFVTQAGSSLFVVWGLDLKRDSHAASRLVLKVYSLHVRQVHAARRADAVRNHLLAAHSTLYLARVATGLLR